MNLLERTEISSTKSQPRKIRTSGKSFIKAGVTAKTVSNVAGKEGRWIIVEGRPVFIKSKLATTQ